VFESFGSCSLNRSLEPVKRPRLLKISQSHLDSPKVNLIIKGNVASRNLFPSASSPYGCFIFYSHNFTSTATHNIDAFTVNSVSVYIMFFTIYRRTQKQTVSIYLSFATTVS
jgi:hypothetical protein